MLAVSPSDRGNALLQILKFLPSKMRTDIAMRVHYKTLMKVKLFRNCDSGLLKNLVVLLKPIIYLPGDYVCRKNDVGKEGRPFAFAIEQTVWALD